MNMTFANLMEVFTPLLLALHEKKVLDIAEVPHYYEDALERRKMNLGETEADLAFLRELVKGLDRLAKAVKEEEKGRPL